MAPFPQRCSPCEEPPPDLAVIGLGHGQVWWADLHKVRPVVILTRASVAPLLHRVLVAPVTATIRDIPSEVALGPGSGVEDGSVANLDNVQLLPVSALLRRAGALDTAIWRQICAAMTHVMACTDREFAQRSAAMPVSR